MNKTRQLIKVCIIAIIILLIVTGSIWRPNDQIDMVKIFTLQHEFDFFGWTINSLIQKLHSSSLGSVRYLNDAQKRQILIDIFRLQDEANQISDSIETILSDPNYENPDEKILTLTQELSIKESELKQQAILAEGVVQDYVSQALKELGVVRSGQPFPPVLYHITDLPKNLIISPRHIIRQEKSISLYSDLTPLEIVTLEKNVEDLVDYSALVVTVGGVSTYPSMVIRTSGLPYLLETVAHEWIHHYLFFRPLGFNFSSSPQLRTMNETTANIAGEEISQYIMRKYFLDLIKSPQPYGSYEVFYHSFSDDDPVPFNFQKEMYHTRIQVNEMLEENKIEEAEAFMEERRIFFWKNGYQIRRLNQAYFAFHGAYADRPFSAAGADPVGEDVRSLRYRSRSLAEFLNTISWMSSYETLKSMVRSY